MIDESTNRILYVADNLRVITSIFLMHMTHREIAFATQSESMTAGNTIQQTSASKTCIVHILR